MPRQAHGLPVSGKGTKKSTKRKQPKSQYYNALEIAEKQNPTRIKVQQHRLGDVEEDSTVPQSRAALDERSSKRRKISNDSDDDDLVAGSDSDGNRWHVGVEEDDEDSDIDSDEAFGESDEERFAGYTFRGSASDRPGAPQQSKKNQLKPRAQDIDLSEGEEEVDLDENEGLDDDEEDDLGNDAVDLATAWDLDDEDEAEDRQELDKRSRQQGVDRAAPNTDEPSDLDASEFTASSEDEEGSELSFSADENEGAHSQLQSFVEGLTAPSSGGRAAKPALARMSENGPSSSKLTAADLLQYVKDPRQRQSLKVLDNSEKVGAERYQGGIPGKLEPPLAKRQQDRLDRAAAYDKSKETLDRWIETVKLNRRAEHISFPLHDPSAESTLAATNLAPTSQSEPRTQLESTIQEIMRESGLASKHGPSADEQERGFEELEEKKMPIEEVQARRAELRMARELMFREEIRARRIKKIKSKAYRRVHRKERDKSALEERAYRVANGLVDSDEERERNDRLRAEERMGARHRESRWAKSVKTTGRATWDEDARHSLSDLARRDDELRRRIEGKTVRGSDGPDDQSSSTSDDEYSSGDDGDFKGFDKKLDQLEEEPLSTATSRLGSMAFMRKAEAAKKAANDEELQDLRRALHGSVEGDEPENEESIGRLRFGGQKQANTELARLPVEKSEFEERMSDDEMGPGDHPVPRHTQERAAPLQAKKVIEKPQPHLLSKSRIGEGHGAAVVGHPRLASKGTVDQVRGQSAVNSRAMDDNSGDSEPPSDDEASALAKFVFAGNDLVHEDFEREKQKTIEDEGDQVIDNTLPGWGSWAGEGISKREQRRAKGRFVTTVKGVSAEDRKDAKLERVIVNEKRVKKNGKYLAPELPHPFESRQQYERSLRLPIGPEWTTKSTFQDATKPRVLVKQGIIRPMARPIA